MENSIRVRKTDEHNQNYEYFIDSIHYSQTGYKTYKEAFMAGIKKVESLKKYKK